MLKTCRPAAFLAGGSKTTLPCHPHRTDGRRALQSGGLISRREQARLIAFQPPTLDRLVAQELAADVGVAPRTATWLPGAAQGTQGAVSLRIRPGAEVADGLLVQAATLLKAGTEQSGLAGTVDAIRAKLKGSPVVVLAEMGDEVVGVCALKNLVEVPGPNGEHTIRISEMGFLAVHPRHQGAGIGGALIDTVKQAARVVMNLDAWYADTLVSNYASLKLQQSEGSKIVLGFLLKGPQPLRTYAVQLVPLRGGLDASVIRLCRESLKAYFPKVSGDPGAMVETIDERHLESAVDAHLQRLSVEARANFRRKKGVDAILKDVAGWLGIGRNRPATWTDCRSASADRIVEDVICRARQMAAALLSVARV